MKTKTLRPVFGEKHQAYIRQAIKSTISVAEGAVRAGKTIDNITAFAYMINAGTPDRIHLATGSTAANAKLNIGDANGFGLEYIFRGRCKWTKYRGNEALAIESHGKDYIVIFAGGAKADSYKKIRGNSYGMWIATEINLHHEDTVKEAFNRQLAARERRILWDLNPSHPHAWIYEDYINRFTEQFGDKYNYQHFTINDNDTITPQRLKEIEAQYEKGSIWYRRDILGERCVAEGLIYRDFADNTNKYLIEDAEKWLKDTHRQLLNLFIGVDFGGTGSATTFQATGITTAYEVIAMEEEYLPKDIDPDALNRAYSDFVKKINNKYGRGQTRADSAEQILIRGLFNTAKKERLGTEVKNAMKMPINDRIRLTLLLMAQGRLYVSKNCPYLTDAFQTAVYDPKQINDVRLDNGTSNIDSLDAFEYSIEPVYKRLELAGHNRENDK